MRGLILFLIYLNDTYIRTSFTLWTMETSFSLQSRRTRRTSYAVQTRFTFLTYWKSTGIRWLTLFSFRTLWTFVTARSRVSGKTMMSGLTLENFSIMQNERLARSNKKNNLSFSCFLLQSLNTHILYIFYDVTI